MLEIPLLYRIVVILILCLSLLLASFGFIVNNSSRFLVAFKHWMGCLYIHIFIIVFENADFGVLPPYLLYICQFQASQIAQHPSLLIRFEPLAFITVFKLQFKISIILWLQDDQRSSSLISSSQHSDQTSSKISGNGNAAMGNHSLPPINLHSSSTGSTPSTPRSSSQLIAQRKLSESQTGQSSFQKLLEPSLPQRPGLAPYRIVLGNVKDKVIFFFSSVNIKDNG